MYMSYLKMNEKNLEDTSVLLEGGASVPSSSSIREPPAPRVLMIEDDPFYCKFIRQLLNRRRGTKFDVIYVNTLAEASRYLAREMVDVILLDLGLPDGKGLANLSKVKEFSSGIPVIILTGSDDEEAGLQAVAQGAQDYLVKQNIGNESLSRCLLYSMERRKAEVSNLRYAAIRDFTATLAHDLQVPLIGSANVLDAMVSGQFGALPDNLVEVIAVLRESNKKQLELVKKLLQAYRYEITPSDFPVSRVLLSQIITRCVQDASSSVPIAVDLPDEPITVLGDEEALYSLFANLIDNAIKFSDGFIEVRVIVRQGKVAIEVHNSGPQIPPEVRAELFQRFWQGVPGKTYLSHTGLGLYLCHSIVTLHRGTICCESSEQAGTTITVWLPTVL